MDVPVTVRMFHDGFPAGGQTHPPAGCRPGSLWERAEGETGYERLREHRRKSREKYAARPRGFRPPVESDRRSFYWTVVNVSRRGWSPGAEREEGIPRKSEERFRGRFSQKEEDKKQVCFGPVAPPLSDSFLCLMLTMCFPLDFQPGRERRPPADAAVGRLGHAGGPQRADVLPVPPGVVRRDDWMR